MKLKKFYRRFINQRYLFNGRCYEKSNLISWFLIKFAGCRDVWKWKTIFGIFYVKRWRVSKNLQNPGSLRISWSKEMGFTINLCVSFLAFLATRVRGATQVHADVERPKKACIRHPWGRWSACIVRASQIVVTVTTGALHRTGKMSLTNHKHVATSLNQSNKRTSLYLDEQYNIFIDEFWTAGTILPCN